jgi:hypothetical protein
MDGEAGKKKKKISTHILSSHSVVPPLMSSLNDPRSDEHKKLAIEVLGLQRSCYELMIAFTEDQLPENIKPGSTMETVYVLLQCCCCFCCICLFLCLLCFHTISHSLESMEFSFFEDSLRFAWKLWTERKDKSKLSDLDAEVMVR